MTDQKKIEKLRIEEIIDHCKRACEQMELIAVSQGKKQDEITSKTYWEHYQVQDYLEELQQYRAIGTPNELKQLKENGAFTGVELAQLASMQMQLREYQSIGTPDECQEAVEKQRAKKSTVGVQNFYKCANCQSVIRQTDKFCHECGQKLDWSEEE